MNWSLQAINQSENREADTVTDSQSHLSGCILHGYSLGAELQVRLSSCDSSIGQCLLGLIDMTVENLFRESQGPVSKQVADCRKCFLELWVRRRDRSAILLWKGSRGREGPALDRDGWCLGGTEVADETAGSKRSLSHGKSEDRPAVQRPAKDVQETVSSHRQTSGPESLAGQEIDGHTGPVTERVVVTDRVHQSWRSHSLDIISQKLHVDAVWHLHPAGCFEPVSVLRHSWHRF